MPVLLLMDQDAGRLPLVQTCSIVNGMQWWIWSHWNSVFALEASLGRTKAKCRCDLILLLGAVMFQYQMTSLPDCP